MMSLDKQWDRERREISENIIWKIFYIYMYAFEIKILTNLKEQFVLEVDNMQLLIRPSMKQNPR